MVRLRNIAVTLAAVFVMLELTARVYVFGPAGLDPIRIGSVRSIFDSGLLMHSENAQIGFELRPNLDTWFKLVRFRTNSRGLRDSEHSVRKPAGVFRVAVMGSSFTLPTGVEIEDAYHSRLEASFDRSSGPTRFEFVNFSVGAHHPFQTVAMLEHRALGYRPDLILFAVTRMAVGPMLSSRRPRQRQLETGLHPAFHSFLWKLVSLRAGWTATPQVVPEVFPISAPEPGPSAIERLAEISRASGIPVVIVRLEFMNFAEPETDWRLRHEAERLGLHYVDTRNAFRDTDPRSLWISELDPHPDARAHALFAQVLETDLLEQGLVGSSNRPLSGPGIRTGRSAENR